MRFIQQKYFKDLTLTELYSIIKLRVNIFIVEQNCPYPELDDLDQDSIHFFYKEEEEVVAYLRIIPNKEGNIRIGRVASHKNFRGHGLSSNLLKEAMEYIYTNLVNKTIKISAQEHLQHFYVKFGFKPVTEMYLEDGIPHVAMELRT